MAEVIGFLRTDATHGEKQTLSLPGRNLPKEFTVYVESPIHKSRDIRYPDAERARSRNDFPSPVQNTFRREEDDYVAAERRILYMAMSRAREKLYMTYFGKLPRPYEDLRREHLADFVG